jgi:hypothetical protein
MTRLVVGDDRSQSTLFPERLEDYLSEDNPVRAIDVFVESSAEDQPEFSRSQRYEGAYRLRRGQSITDPKARVGIAFAGKLPMKQVVE